MQTLVTFYFLTSRHALEKCNTSEISEYLITLTSYPYEETKLFLIFKEHYKQGDSGMR